MVNTIIFDFGDVFINKDKEGKIKKFAALGLTDWNEELEKLEGKLETGKINEEGFLNGIRKHI
ncbi:MAG: HAD family phosphatase, partial [Flavobacterium sp.]